jgi:cytoskeletal protein RodZ
MENVALIESIGSYLKSLREQKKMTLEHISEITRIKVRLLEEIENDIFSNLGGVGYAKAMIINYARHMNADEEKIMSIFNEKFSQKPIHISREKSIEEKKYVLPTNFFAMILLVAVIIVLTALVIYLYNNDILSWPPFKKIDRNKIEVKEEVFNPDTELNELEEEVAEEETVSLNKQALHDTTDYLNELMFKDKKSPLNYEK